MYEFTPENLWGVIENLRRADENRYVRNNLVHCFMNYVAAADCANALLAVGAKPVMADCLAECAEITERAGALVLNMGTFSEERGKAMLLSGKAANKANIPVILDPVGLHASSLRQKWFARFVKELRISAIKGNILEIPAAVGISDIAGIPFGDDNPYPVWLARKAAQKFGCPVLITGGEDYLSDGKRVFRIDNGTPHLAAVTGTGCMTGALIGAFSLAVGGNAIACAAAVSLMDICGEMAAENFRGTGTFRTALMDNLSQITRREYLSRIRITETEQ